MYIHVAMLSDYATMRIQETNRLLGLWSLLREHHIPAEYHITLKLWMQDGGGQQEGS